MKRATAFRFSIRGLLAVVALFAVGFTWPLLFVFILPLIAVVLFDQLRRGWLAVFFAIAVSSLGLGIIFSLNYWRYPFAQPRLLAPLRDISVVEQLSFVSGVNFEKNSAPTITTISTVPGAQSLQWNTATEIDAIQRILQYLDKRKIPIESQQPLSPELVASIWNAANDCNLLIDGDYGYADTKTLYGHVGIARLHNGARIAFATVMGNQYSNDHYPYYEFILPLDKVTFTIRQSQWFFVDVAGIEGANWLSFAVMSFIAMVPIAILILAIWEIIKR
jgi:hypothetical protein